MVIDTILPVLSAGENSKVFARAVPAYCRIYWTALPSERDPVGPAREVLVKRHCDYRRLIRFPLQLSYGHPDSA